MKLIWITGYSGAGKTTVARELVRLLQENNKTVIHLDGDELRNILCLDIGFDMQSRRLIAKLYFRICALLVGQGFWVVISAIAMFSEIFNWVRGNFSNSVVVLLRVPESELLNRDLHTKRIYLPSGGLPAGYDLPDSPDIIVDNYGQTSSRLAASNIYNYVNTAIPESLKAVDKSIHWNSYYSQKLAPAHPSSFAVQVQNPPGRILEIGCGNGRDAVYFSQIGFEVTACDPSAAAIKIAKERHSQTGVLFFLGTAQELEKRGSGSYDIVYCRFVLHAMNEREELATFKSVFRLLKPGGLFLIECRSVNDPLASKGALIGPNERFFGHYRRFIERDELVVRLKNQNFGVQEISESSGLAATDQEDPIVIRVKAFRPS